MSLIQLPRVGAGELSRDAASSRLGNLAAGAPPRSLGESANNNLRVVVPLPSPTSMQPRRLGLQIRKGSGWMPGSPLSKWRMIGTWGDGESEERVEFSDHPRMSPRGRRAAVSALVAEPSDAGTLVVPLTDSAGRLFGVRWQQQGPLRF